MTPGTPTASKQTSSRLPSTRRHASMRGSCHRVDDLGSAEFQRERRLAGDRSEATMTSTPCDPERGDHGQPDWPASHDRAAWRAVTADAATAWIPTASGSVRAAMRGSKPFGTGRTSGAESSIRSANPPGYSLL